MRLASALILIAATMVPVPALAQAAPAAPLPSEHRLAPEEIEAVLAEAAKKREADQARLGPEAIEQARPLQVQGEMGVAIGTGGYRQAYGTAIVPVGEEGAAAISFDFLDLGKRRYKR